MMVTGTAIVTMDMTVGIVGMGMIEDTTAVLGSLKRLTV
jgi:hypothetical protein